jgi:hypothetical protein
MLRSLFRRTIATRRNRFSGRGHHQPAAVENVPNSQKEIITLEEYIDKEETGSVDSALVRRRLVAEGSEGGWSSMVSNLSTNVQLQLSTMLHHPKAALQDFGIAELHVSVDGNDMTVFPSNTDGQANIYFKDPSQTNELYDGTAQIWPNKTLLMYFYTDQSAPTLEMALIAVNLSQRPTTMQLTSRTYYVLTVTPQGSPQVTFKVSFKSSEV